MRKPGYKKAMRSIVKKETEKAMEQFKKACEKKWETEEETLRD
jgi:hypothetical protein